MTKLYKKSEITFVILWIAAYVILSSLADQLSEAIGIIKSVTVVLHIAMSLILFFWIKHNKLDENTVSADLQFLQSAFCITCRLLSLLQPLFGTG